MKAAPIERWILTFKRMLYKEMSLRGTFSYLSFLPELMDKYNNTIHSVTHLKPKDVTKKHEKKLLETVFKIPKNTKIPKFKEGDVVRVSKIKMVFDKSYNWNFTPELFIVSEVVNTNPTTYKLRDKKDNIILGGFYEAELQKVKHDDAYLIEKILKKKNKQVLVKWAGFPESEASWIAAKDISR